MPMSLLSLLGVILVGVGVWGLISGKVVAGSRVLQSSFYTKKDTPLLYYSFIFVYLAIGFLIFSRVL